MPKNIFFSFRPISRLNIDIKNKFEGSHMAYERPLAMWFINSVTSTGNRKSRDVEEKKKRVFD